MIGGGTVVTDSTPHTQFPIAAEREFGGDYTLDEIRDSLQNLRFGSVNIIVQDGVVIQIDRTEKKRLQLRRANQRVDSSFNQYNNWLLVSAESLTQSDRPTIFRCRLELPEAQIPRRISPMVTSLLQTVGTGNYAVAFAGSTRATSPNGVVVALLLVGVAHRVRSRMPTTLLLTPIHESPCSIRRRDPCPITKQVSEHRSHGTARPKSGDADLLIRLGIVLASGNGQAGTWCDSGCRTEWCGSAGSCRRFTTGN